MRHDQEVKCANCPAEPIYVTSIKYEQFGDRKVSLHLLISRTQSVVRNCNLNGSLKSEVGYFGSKYLRIKSTLDAVDPGFDFQKPRPHRTRLKQGIRVVEPWASSLINW